MQYIRSLADVADLFQTLLCDIWGVLHNGGFIMPAARHALERFRESGAVGTKRIVLVSNAPYPGNLVPSYLEEKGLPTALIDGIVTAGDMTRLALMNQPFGNKCFFIGNTRDKVLLQDVPVQMVPLEQAEFALVTGVEKQYESLLRQLHARGIPLVCANPDHVVRMGAGFFPCAGLFAAAYKDLGGTCFYFGKPQPSIYTHALGLVNADPHFSLIIGDSRSTDIQGAYQANLPSLFIASGIHMSECFETDSGVDTFSLEKTRQLFTSPIVPNYVMDYLV